MVHFDYLWKCLTLFFVGICLFQLAAGQNYTFLPVEFGDECKTALITFELVVGDNFRSRFFFYCLCCSWNWGKLNVTMTTDRKPTNLKFDLWSILGSQLTWFEQTCMPWYCYILVSNVLLYSLYCAEVCNELVGAISASFSGIARERMLTKMQNKKKRLKFSTS